MSAITDFFRKYHAVRGTNAGPDYASAGRDALYGQARAAVHAWDRNPAARETMLADMRNLREETRKRSMTGIWASICDRIGRD